MGRTNSRVAVSVLGGLFVLAVFLVVSNRASAGVVTGQTAEATPTAPSARPPLRIIKSAWAVTRTPPNR